MAKLSPNTTKMQNLNQTESFTMDDAKQCKETIPGAGGNDPTATMTTTNNNSSPLPPSEKQTMSKSQQKKLLKQQKYEAKKAEKKAAEKERRKREVERKRREWDEKLSTLSEEDKSKLMEARREIRKERMGHRNEERRLKIEKLTSAKEKGQNIVVDLEFSDRMQPNEIHSLVQQIMYCYAMNSRCISPAHLWLTGCQGEMGSELEKIPGFDKWIIEKEQCSYIETFESQKEHLVYLTADSETMLYELDTSKIYIVGGLVDRNRLKGITMNKAKYQGIQTAKLPIGDYLKMSSSQVLTVNQVIEILLKFLETRDWKASFFQVIPPRKRCEVDSEGCEGGKEGDDNEVNCDQESKRQRVEI